DADRYAPDLVIHDRYSELPGVTAQESIPEDRVQEPAPRRRTPYRERRAQMQASAAEIVYDDAPIIEQSPLRRRRQTDQVTGTSLHAASIAGDTVTGTRGASRTRTSRSRSRRG